MKTYLKFFFNFMFLIICGHVFAQGNEDARALVKEGIQFNNQGKYAEAIEKYNQALKIDTGNYYADYQLASTLFNMNRGNEGIPLLQKVIRSDSSLRAAAYDLLGFTWFREKKYIEAENCAVEVLKLNPKQAGSQRMYALVAFHQNKRAAALLGFCSFILLEPNTARSVEAYGNIQHILTGGVLKPEPGVVLPPLDADNIALNQAITKAVAEAAKMKYNTEADLLAAQLKNIFIAIGQLAEKQTGNDFFRNYMAGYFYKLAQSNNMPAFARFLNQINRESAKWINDNPRYMNDLYSWVRTSERGF